MNKARHTLTAGLTTTAVLLAACGGSGGGNAALGGACASITGGGTSVDRSGTCTNCTGSNLGAAADDNVNSIATLFHPEAAAGSNALRVTAQDGVVYPAGTPAMVINAVDYSGNSVSTSLTLQTYLDGVPQESSPIGAFNGIGGPDEAPARRGFTAQLPFDALEIQFQRSGGAGTVSVSVHEFCTN